MDIQESQPIGMKSLGITLLYKVQPHSPGKFSSKIGIACLQERQFFSAFSPTL
jgi:hypothetical protein